MHVCPICGNSGTELRVCGNCGFDLSADAVRYPTLKPITAAMRKTRAEARQRWELSQGAYAIPKKELTENLVHVITKAKEKKASQEGAYAVSGEKLVDHQIKTGAADAKDELKKSEYSAAGDELVEKTLKQEVKKPAPKKKSAAGSGAASKSGTSAKTAQASGAANTSQTKSSTKTDTKSGKAGTGGNPSQSGAGTKSSQSGSAAKTAQTSGSANSPQNSQTAAGTPKAPEKRRGSCFGAIIGLLFWVFVGAIISYLVSVGGWESIVGIGVVILVVILIFRARKK